MDFLLGVPGRLAAVLGRLTQSRADKLDNLDAAITTRAPASTALSIAQWTNARALLLDNLASLLTGVVNSIQTGYASAPTSSGSGEDTAYADVMVSAVTVAKAFPLILVADAQSTSKFWTARLTSTTNLRLSCTAAAGLVRIRWYLIEFK